MDLLELWHSASWQTVFDHVLLVIGAVGVAAIPSYFAHRNHKGIKAVQDQVKNAHTTNLRDDIDRVSTAVQTVQSDLRGLRQDVAVEEGHRRHQISEIREYQRQLRDDIDRRFDDLHATVTKVRAPQKRPAPRTTPKGK